MILAAALLLAASAAEAREGAAPVERAPSLRPITVALSTGGFDDSSGVSAVNPRLVARFALPREAELALGGGLSRVGRDGEATEETTLGASLVVPWDHATASFSYALHASGATRHDVEARIRVAPSESFQAAVAVRRRAFVDVVPTLAVDDQLFHDAGPGGASRPLEAARLEVEELRLAASGSPVRWTYAYGEARNLWIDDGNHAWTLSGGVGVNVTRLFLARPPVDVSARWDLYAATFERVEGAYYSPSSVVSHTPGAELRRRVGPVELAVEGGYTLASDGSRGWLAGALASLRAGRVSATVRGQLRDDPWYRSRRVWLVVERAL